ncbi:unnamed protein product, partial [Didymodactylos carnosus]
MCFIRGRPRHPQSQGLAERGNGVLCDSLDSDYWRIIKDQNIEVEEMLSVLVEAQQKSGESTNDYALLDEANSVL